MTTETLSDPARVVAELDAFWAGSPRGGYLNEPLTALRDSKFGQEPDAGNPYWEIVRRLPLDRYTSDRVVHGHAAEVEGSVKPSRYSADYIVGRHLLTMRYAWAIPTPGDLAWIKSVVDGRGVVEVGAGGGYWASQLTRVGVDVLAFDKEPGGNIYSDDTTYFDVRYGDVDVAAALPNRALMLCWPPYSEAMAENVLRAYSGDLLIYIGEPECGCTADDGFFSLLDKEWDSVGASPHHVTFAGIHCYVEAYRRKAVTA